MRKIFSFSPGLQDHVVKLLISGAFHLNLAQTFVSNALQLEVECFLFWRGFAQRYKRDGVKMH